jgi:DMSO/TMAO reductase YedYZ molybdopterin-dependent catalytic subunit
MGGAEVDTTKWRLVITGMVDQPFALTLKQLKSLPSKTVTSFVECYGSPLVPPTKALRRIGNVRWTGVPLHSLLEKAIVQPGVQYIWSEGLDRGAFAGEEADRYQKDVPIEKAMEPEVLVAYEINGQPLSRNRGGPVRLVVPGWFGTNSTKWLSKLTVTDRRAPSIFTTKFYNERYPPDDPTCEYKPIWKVQPNSMIVRPVPESQVKGPDVVVEGWAWSCDGVDRVDVSLDEGQTWYPSHIHPRTEYSWQKYWAKLTLERGTYVVLAKATGHDGREQPLGVGRNHVHRVKIEVL